MAITKFFPRLYFIKGEVITLASLVSGEKSLAPRSNDHCFAANDPPFRVGLSRARKVSGGDSRWRRRIASLTAHRPASQPRTASRVAAMSVR
jgi:hypothetical protein